MNQSTAGGRVAFWQIEALSFAHQDLNKVFPELVSQYRCGPVTVDCTVCLKSATFFVFCQITSYFNGVEERIWNSQWKAHMSKGHGVGKKKKRGKKCIKGQMERKE